MPTVRGDAWKPPACQQFVAIEGFRYAQFFDAVMYRLTSGAIELTHGFYAFL